MSSTIETLRRMANDIARNLAAMGHDQAVLATADHVDKFWDPRMKRAIFADGGTGLTPIAREALVEIAASPLPLAGGGRRVGRAPGIAWNVRGTFHPTPGEPVDHSHTAPPLTPRANGRGI